MFDAAFDEIKRGDALRFFSHVAEQRDAEADAAQRVFDFVRELRRRLPDGRRRLCAAAGGRAGAAAAAKP